MTVKNQQLNNLLAEVKACRLCADSLPLGPRPVVRISQTARLLIIGQAPGTKVHESGTPWNDASGDRLRDWLGVSRNAFYDDTKIAIMPMGFCYPGRAKNGGDNPPRKECAPAWHDRLFAQLKSVELTLLVGSYAQKYYLKDNPYPSMTETVRHGQDFLPKYLPLPHPSWRNTHWVKKNPWFESDILPVLRSKVLSLT